MGLTSPSEVQRLRDRVAELEAQLGRDKRMADRLCVAFNLGRKQAELLALIVNRHIATYDAVFLLLWGSNPDCDQPESNVIEQHISRLRRKLRPHGLAISNHLLAGWSMSEAHKAVVRAAAHQMEAA